MWQIALRKQMWQMHILSVKNSRPTCIYMHPCIRASMLRKCLQCYYMPCETTNDKGSSSKQRVLAIMKLLLLAIISEIIQKAQLKNVLIFNRTHMPSLDNENNIKCIIRNNRYK